jgi:hypothetical protein
MKTYSKRTVIKYPVWVHSKRTIERANKENLSFIHLDKAEKHRLCEFTQSPKEETAVIQMDKSDIETKPNTVSQLMEKFPQAEK